MFKRLLLAWFRRILRAIHWNRETMVERCILRMSLSLPAERLDQFGVREILDSLADGVYITDVERSIVFWNRAATRITGWAPEEVLGHTCYDNILIRIERISPDLYVAMVAEVMGHGVASALFTMQLRSLWEECRQELASPGRS